jgi:hypothetical protein
MVGIKSRDRVGCAGIGLLGTWPYKKKAKQSSPSAVQQQPTRSSTYKLAGQTLPLIVSAELRLRVLARLQDFCCGRRLPLRLPHPITNLILQLAQSDSRYRGIVAKPLRTVGEVFVQLDRASNPDKAVNGCISLPLGLSFFQAATHRRNVGSSTFHPLYFSRILQRVSEC